MVFLDFFCIQKPFSWYPDSDISAALRCHSENFRAGDWGGIFPLKTALDCPKSTVKINFLSRTVKFVLAANEAGRDTSLGFN